MGDVTFTEYLLPDGKRRSLTITCEDEIADKANALRAEGWQFEIETLQTGKVHLDCCNDEEQLANEVVEDRYSVVKRAIDNLISNAYDRLQGRKHTQ